MPKMREKEDHHVGSLHGRDLLLCFIMVIMDMLVSSNDLLNTEDKQTIYTVSVLVIAGAVSEWLGVWMDGADSALRILHILVETIELSSAPIITAAPWTTTAAKWPGWSNASVTTSASATSLRL